MLFIENTLKESPWYYFLMIDVSRRTALTLGASAGVALFFPKLRAQAQELSLEGQTMPYADFRKKIQENLLRGRGEVGFEHTPPTADGSITILGMRSAESGTTSITPIGKAIQYLQKNPDVVAIESGHTHPREVYAFGRSSGGFFGSATPPHESQIRGYDLYSAPIGVGDAGTYLLTQYEARKAGLNPRRILNTARDAHGVWSGVATSQKDIDTLVFEYQLPKEFFSRSKSELQSAYTSARERVREIRPQLVTAALTVLSGQNPESRKTFLNDKYRASWYHTDFAKADTDEKKRESISRLLSTYVRDLGYNREIVRQGHGGEYYMDAYKARAVCAVLFVPEQLHQYFLAERNGHFIGLQRSFVVGAQTSVKESQRLEIGKKLQSEYGVPDEEVDFAISALAYRQDQIRASERGTHAVAERAAELRKEFPHWPEEAIQRELQFTTDEHLVYKMNMMRRFGQTIQYRTDNEHASFMSNEAELKEVVEQ